MLSTTIKITQLGPVVSYVVRGAHKFSFTSAVNEIPNKRQPVERRSCSDHDFCCQQDPHFPNPLNHCRECKGTAFTLCKSKTFSWVKDGTCMVHHLMS
jgi:hypothetical protein